MAAATLPNHAMEEALIILLKHLKMPADDESESYSREIEGKKGHTVQQLQRMEETMGTVAVMFTDMVKYRMSTLRRLQNDHSPIHHLPTEILTSIFETVVEGELKRSGATISKVCSHWREVALSTPRLWSYLNSQSHKSLLEISIERSRNAPLHIVIWASPHKRQEASFLDLVVPHLSHWETFECHSHISYGLLLPHLDRTVFPLLLSFHAIFPNGYGSFMPYAVSHKAPRLESLEVSLYSVPRGSPTLSRLRNVTLNTLMRGDDLLSEKWYSFLSSTPELETIHVLGRELYMNPTPAFIPFDVILPRLKTISLKNLPLSVTGLLLSSISSNRDTPPLVKIYAPSMDDEIGYHEEQGFELMFPQTTSETCLLASIRAMTSISADYWDGEGGIDLHAWSKTQSKLLEYFGYSDIGSASDLWRSLLLPSTLPNLRKIDINGSAFFDNNAFSSNLHQCTSLEHLFIQSPDLLGQSDNLRDVCDHLTLAHSTFPAQDKNSWPCQKLKYLGVLIESMDFSPVADMIQARYGEGLGSLGKHTISKLEELRLASTEIVVDSSELLGITSVARVKKILNPLETVVRIVDIGDFSRNDLPDVTMVDSLILSD